MILRTHSHLITLFSWCQASTDQSVADLRLPGQFAYVAIASINILGIIGVMVQVAWQVLFIFIPVVAACAWYRVYSSLS